MPDLSFSSSNFLPFSISFEFRCFFQFVRFPTVLDLGRYPTFLSLRPIFCRPRVRPISDISFSSSDFRPFSIRAFEFGRFPTILLLRPMSDRSRVRSISDRSLDRSVSEFSFSSSDFRTLSRSLEFRPFFHFVRFPTVLDVRL